MEEHSLTQELNGFCKMITKIDKLIESINKSKEKGKYVSFYRSEFRYISRGRIHRYFDVNVRSIIRYLDEQNEIFNKDNLNNEGKILDFQEQLINNIISEENSMVELKEYKKLARRLINEPSKIISILILSNYNEYFRHIPIVRAKKINSENLTHLRAILIMSILKLLLSTIYSHFELSSKEISLSFDDNSIIEIFDEFSKNDLSIDKK